MWSRAEHASNPLMVRCVTCGTQLHGYAARPSPPPRRHKMCRGVPSLRAGQHYCLASCSALGGATPLPDNEGSCHHHRLDSSVQRRRVISTSSRASITASPSAPPSAEQHRSPTMKGAATITALTAQYSGGVSYLLLRWQAYRIPPAALPQQRGLKTAEITDKHISN